MTVKARELWNTLHEDRRARRRALLGATALCAALAWFSVWLLLVVAYVVVAMAVLLRSELLHAVDGGDDDWF